MRVIAGTERMNRVNREAGGLPTKRKVRVDKCLGLKSEREDEGGGLFGSLICEPPRELPPVNSHKAGGWPTHPLGKQHDPRKANQRTVYEVVEHTFGESRQFTGNFLPCHPSFAAFRIDGSVHGTGVEAENAPRSGFGKTFTVQWSSVISRQEAFRCPAQPTENLKDDGAGDGTLLPHSLHGACADGN